MLTHRMFKSIGAAFFLALILSLSCQSFAADSTSFDPVPIPVISKNTGGGVPIGTIIAWPVTKNPEDMDKWLECNGQSVNSAVYPELFAVVGSRVPNFRGLFLRGYGSQAHSQNNGVNVGITQTTHQSGELGRIQGDASRDWAGGGFNINGHIAASGKMVRYIGNAPRGQNDKTSGGNYIIDISNSSPIDNEYRPANTAVRYLIKAKD